MGDLGKDSVLETEITHVTEMLALLNHFNDVLSDKGLGRGGAASRMDQVIETLMQYQGMIAQVDDIDTSVVSQTQKQLSSFLIGTKAQLFNDVMTPVALSQLPAVQDEATDLLSTNASTDLFESLIAMTQPGNHAGASHDDVFAKFDHIIKKQMDYTAQLSSNDLVSKFSDMINGNERARESVSKLIDSTNEFAQSILPALDHLNHRVNGSLALLESNQKNIELSQEKIAQVEETQAATSSKILRTQIGINKTRSEMGMAPEFNTSLGVVSDGVRGGDNLLEAANDQGQIPEP